MGRLKTLKSTMQTIPNRLQTINTNSWRAGKTTAAQRGYDSKWQKARLVHLDANPLCVYCERIGRVMAANTVDHVIPHRGDMALFWDQFQLDVPVCNLPLIGQAGRGSRCTTLLISVPIYKLSGFMNIRAVITLAFSSLNSPKRHKKSTVALR